MASGKIIIPSGRKPWPHELHTAAALANAGFVVRFIREDKNIGSADSFRMKRLRDDSIKNYLISRLKARKGIKKLLFVTKNGVVIDINSLI